VFEALLRRFEGSASSGFTSATSQRSLAAVIELVFGLFLISGTGFLYLQRRLAGWGVLLLRLAVLMVVTSAAVEVHPLFGLAGMVVSWAVPPVILAYLVSRWNTPAVAVDTREGASAELESLGWLGLGGIGWSSSGRTAVGVTLLVVRLLMLGAGVVFLPLFFLAAADECVDDGENCTSLQLGVLLASLFWLALWLAFPLVSAALLRAANGMGLKVAVPRALVWIVAGLLALLIVNIVLLR
jgi:hypothetical protein